MHWTIRTFQTFFVLLAISGCSVSGTQDDNIEKRSLGTKLDDNKSAKLIMQNLKAANPEISSMNLAVTVFNGVALLTGQANSETVKNQAGATAEQIRHIAKVHNEIEVKGPTARLVRSSDALLKAKIKLILGMDEAVDASRIKVVVENGVVYLMGLLTRDEASAAVALTRNIFGVQKIVQAFEFLN